MVIVLLIGYFKIKIKNNDNNNNLSGFKLIIFPSTFMWRVMNEEYEIKLNFNKAFKHKIKLLRINLRYLCIYV